MDKPYHIHVGDCIPHMYELAEKGKKFKFSIFSPPFATLLAYSDKREDMGNSRDSDDEFVLHYEFFANALFPIIEYGGMVCVHLQQVVRQKSVHGHMGLFDIRGAVNTAMEDAGFYLYGEIAIPKNPQAQSIRLKAHQLQFSQWEKDSTVSRPALADWLQIYKKPGELNEKVEPIKNGLTRDTWIDWADMNWVSEHEKFVYPASVWMGIRETAVLNNRTTVDELIGRGHKVSETKFTKDERHMCPLQVDLVRRAILLWTNKGWEVFTPFAGIGSELVVPLLEGRRAYGIELNDNYASEAVRNCDGAVSKMEYSKKILALDLV